MDAIITVVRFPIGILATLFLFCIGWQAEFLIGVLVFPLKSVAWTRQQLKIRYGDWPCNVFATIRNVWHWVFVDEKPPEPYTNSTEEKPPLGLGEFLSNMFGR